MEEGEVEEGRLEGKEELGKRGLVEGKGERHRQGWLEQGLELGPERHYCKWFMLQSNLPGRGQGLGKAEVEEVGEGMGLGEGEG